MFPSAIPPKNLNVPHLSPNVGGACDIRQNRVSSFLSRLRGRKARWKRRARVSLRATTRWQTLLFPFKERVGAKSGDPETCWVHAAEGEEEEEEFTRERGGELANKEKGELLLLRIRKKRWSRWRELRVCSWCLLPGTMWKSRRQSRGGRRQRGSGVEQRGI